MVLGPEEKSTFFRRRFCALPISWLRLLPGAVVLLLVDLLGQLVLLLVERVAVSGGQMAAVSSAHLLLFFSQVRFFAFKLGRFISGEPPVLDAIRDALLLV
jgi:hypothetical protein